MRKSLIGCLMLVGTSLASSAFGQAQFAIGLKGGANFSKIDISDPSATWDGKTGFHGGAFALIKLSKIGIQPELIFSQQGSTVTFNAQDLNSNFSYLNIPLILKLYLIGGLNLQAGPQFGFLISAESDYNPLTNTPQNSSDVKDFYKNSDFSLGLGAGWDAPFGLTFDARYNMGLSEINDNPQVEASKNQVFQLTVGLKLLKFGK
jgi:hypothetical protein